MPCPKGPPACRCLEPSRPLPSGFLLRGIRAPVLHRSRVSVAAPPVVRRRPPACPRWRCVSTVRGAPSSPAVAVSPVGGFACTSSARVRRSLSPGRSSCRSPPRPHARGGARTGFGPARASFRVGRAWAGTVTMADWPRGVGPRAPSLRARAPGLPGVSASPRGPSPCPRRATSAARVRVGRPSFAAGLVGARAVRHGGGRPGWSGRDPSLRGPPPPSPGLPRAPLCSGRPRPRGSGNARPPERRWRERPPPPWGGGVLLGSPRSPYLVDPASSICLSQRLSHACLSTHGWYSETANGSLNQLWFLWSLAPLLLG